MDALHHLAAGGDGPAQGGLPPASSPANAAPEEASHSHAEGVPDAALGDWQSAWIDLGGEG